MREQSTNDPRRSGRLPKTAKTNFHPGLVISVYDLYDLRLTDGAIFRGLRLAGVRILGHDAVLIFHLGNQTLEIAPVQIDKIKRSNQQRGIAYEHAPWKFDQHGEDVNGVSIE